MRYEPQQFADLYEQEIGTRLWQFLNARDNVVRMETATFLARPAVEPLSPFLLSEFGEKVREHRVKQMIGHMVRQVMAARGYEIDRGGMRIARINLFTSGTRYKDSSSRLEAMDMKDRMDLNHGRFRVIGGVLNGKARAIAYLGTRKITESEGADVEEAVMAVQAALDARERSRASKRREPYIGTVDDYTEAFEQVTLAEHERRMLLAHARAPQQTMTATELAQAAGYDSFTSANAHYGKLAKKIGDAAGLPPRPSDQRDEVTYTFTLASGEGEPGEHWRWTLHPEVLDALNSLNIV